MPLDARQLHQTFTVTEVARGLALAGQSDRCVGKRVNIAYGRMITIGQVAEAVLRGRSPDEERFSSAAWSELHLAEPLRDNAYKLPLVRNLIVSTLLELQEAA